MKEFSKETIEIGGKEYTLFLNRAGIVAWEKFCKEYQKKTIEMQEKYKNIIEYDGKDLPDDANPFEGLENLDDIETDKELISKTFKKLYWIMLYTEHHLLISEVDKLYDEACYDYGEENIIALANQMLDDANSNKMEKHELKNLKALRPTN